MAAGGLCGVAESPNEDDVAGLDGKRCRPAEWWMLRAPWLRATVSIVVCGACGLFVCEVQVWKNGSEVLSEWRSQSPSGQSVHQTAKVCRCGGRCSVCVLSLLPSSLWSAPVNHLRPGQVEQQEKVPGLTLEVPEPCSHGTCCFSADAGLGVGTRGAASLPHHQKRARPPLAPTEAGTNARRIIGRRPAAARQRH